MWPHSTGLGLRVRTGLLKFGLIGKLLTILLLVIAACDGRAQLTVPATTGQPPGSSTLTPSVDTTEVSRSPTPNIGLLNGETTWILRSLDGLSPIGESLITLHVNGDSYRGFDGCNYYGGRSGDGTSIADLGGKLSVPYPDRTAMDCPEPKRLKDQADAYMSALMQGQEFPILEGQLEILDDHGSIRLVFVKQSMLPGTLEGTE